MRRDAARRHEGSVMRYYLSFVALGLLMGGVCLLLEIHATPPPAIAMIGLFGAHGEVAGLAGLPA
jgi:xanthosine utilization system XapX-like protein